MKTKYLFLLAGILGFSFSIDAQTFTKAKHDSLITVWNDVNQPDISRLKAIGTIATDGYRFKNLDSALYYGQLQHNFATKTNNKNFIVEALNIQGDAYLLKGEPDKAITFFNDALKISEEINNKKLVIKTLSNFSRVWEAKGEVQKALNYNLRVLKLSEEIKDKEGIGKSLSDIGNNYMKKGDFPIGLEYLKRSKKIFEELGFEYNIVKVQALMAQIYLEMGNLDQAKELILKNLIYFEKTGNQTLMSGSLSNLGGIYVKQGNNKKALEYLERAMIFIEKSGNIPYIAMLSQNIGFIYYEEGNLERALDYLKKSLNYSKVIKNENLIAGANNKMGLILERQGKHKESLTYSTEALTYYQDTGDIKNIQNTAGNLIGNYKALGNYKKALEMNELFHKMRDSLNSNQNQKALIELQVQSDYDKQKAINDVENEKKIAIATQQAKAQRNISIAIGTALLLISLLAYFIFNRLKITRQQKAVIESQKKKVEQSEKYKEQFLANMSHEIRTPMHAISGMANILERNAHPHSQDVFLQAMQTSCNNLVVILNDILDLSKIEAGKLEIKKNSFNLESAVENSIQILKYKAEEKGLILSYDLAEDVPTLIMGDPIRLNQILINIVGNAIKFTERGSVKVLVTTNESNLYFQIKDTGIGISKEKQETIFEAFEQAAESSTKQYDGTGLGLSISKQLVELQDGKIWVESEVNQGSSFYFELPLQLADADAINQNFISEDKLKAMSNSLKGIRILIAEDNPFNQMIAQDDLSYYIEDISIDIVPNGLLAVQKFKNNNFDLILMDVQMPEMNGFEATETIRKIEKTEGRKNNIPIIAMTASLLKTEIDNCYKSGMNYYIPKPYKAEELIMPIFKELYSQNELLQN